MKKIILKIEGMTCSACSNHIEKYLNNQEGVIDASVNLVMGNVLIHYEDYLDVEVLGKYINDSGYKYAGIYDESAENKKDHQKLYLIIMGILLIMVMYVSMAHMLNLPMFLVLNMEVNPLNYALFLFSLALVFILIGYDIIYHGFKNLFWKSPNMDTLVAIGVTVSFIYSFINFLFIIKGNSMMVHNLYFESVCMIIFFIKIGRYIDHNSKEKTKEAIKELVKVTPLKALKKTENGEKEITIDEVNVKDILIVKPGMKVAVDGKIVEGSAHFDESFITGESLPIKKEVGDNVMAGAINYDGTVLYEAIKIGPKSTISEMVHLVLEATNSKMPISRIADRISSYFVPFILVLAFLTFFLNLVIGSTLNEALTTMVTVLVVACPCALGLATPLAIVVAIGVSAKKGILIKSSATLEIASHINHIVFDKTGTLTYGKLKVSNIFNYSDYSEKELLNIVSNLEKNSIHPIAKAFESYKIKDLKVTEYQELSGIGIVGKINRKKYELGNRKILKEVNKTYLLDEEKLTKEGNSIVYLKENANIIALIGVKDILKSDAKKVIKNLQENGYKVTMLTGDNELTAKSIGKELGITNIKANVMPKDKNLYIKKLKEQGEKVIMVGDGINDAPSLTTADIGISFKSSTDIATNAANVIITSEKFSKIEEFLIIGKKTLRNIKQNLFWAFFYNILMLPIAMGLFSQIGLKINPMIASAAMMLSSLCVVFNALRLKKITIRRK